MGTLVFVCPTPGREVSTGVEVDRSNFRKLSRTKTAIFCPRCRMGVDAEWCTSPAIASMSRPASRSLACADYRPVSWLVLWTGIWARSGLANKARLQA